MISRISSDSFFMGHALWLMVRVKVKVHGLWDGFEISWFVVREKVGVKDLDIVLQ